MSRERWYPFHDLGECFLLEWRVPGNTGVWWYAEEHMAWRSVTRLQKRYPNVEFKVVRFVPAKPVAKARKRHAPGTAKAIAARYG